jgi:hypothetical protein
LSNISPATPRPERTDQEGQRRQQGVLDRGVFLGNDAGQVGDERGERDAGRDVLVTDGDQQAHHPLVGSEQHGQAIEKQEMADRVDVGAALREVGVDQVADGRQDCADQDGRKRRYERTDSRPG